MRRTPILFAALIAAIFSAEQAKAQTAPPNMTLNVTTSGTLTTAGTTTTTAQSVTANASDASGLSTVTMSLDAQPATQCRSTTGQITCAASYSWVNAVGVPHTINVVAVNTAGLQQMQQIKFPQ